MAKTTPTKIFPITLKVPCLIFNCRNRASWAVGRPNVPASTNYYLCDSCARSIVEQLPDELKPAPAEQVETVKEQPVEDMHEMAKKFDHRCDECGKTFDTEQGLNMHKIRMHRE